MTYADLIAKLEAAPEGSRELDRAIQMAVLARPDYTPGTGSTRPYTTSLDAALTLVPENFAAINLMIWPGEPAWAVVVGTHEFRGGRAHHAKDGKWGGKGANGAIALTVACLTARTALEAA